MKVKNPEIKTNHTKKREKSDDKIEKNEVILLTLIAKVIVDFILKEEL